MIIATHASTLNYRKAKEVEELLRGFANGFISQKVLEARLKKLECSEVLKFYKEN
jgi:DNA-binding HxlR family transcriptional regulator